MKQRLQTIANMVTPGHSIADIGTDHGFLPIELVRSGKCPHAIAIDIVEGPLERAREHIKQAGLENMIECRLSNGFDELDQDEVDTAVIAGMGGDLISDIILRKPDVVNEMILSPHTHHEKVRAALRQSGFCITDEQMIMDANKYYVFIRALKATNLGKNTDTSYEMPMYDYFGKILIERKDSTLIQYLNKEIEKFNDIPQKQEYITIVKATLSAVR